MAITRVTAVWSGFQGAPGYSNFFFDAFGGGDAVDLEVARVRQFFRALDTILPNSVTINVQREAAILDEATGDLINYQNATVAPDPVTGLVSGAYSSPTGASIGWQTAAIARGRRLRGRTFLVPLAGSSYDAVGTLSTGALTALNAAAEGLIGDGTGPQLVIWSRPRIDSPGSIGEVNGHRVADLAAILRSRRD